MFYSTAFADSSTPTNFHAYQYLRNSFEVKNKEVLKGHNIVKEAEIIFLCSYSLVLR